MRGGAHPSGLSYTAAPAAARAHRAARRRRRRATARDLATQHRCTRRTAAPAAAPPRRRIGGHQHAHTRRRLQRMLRMMFQVSSVSPVNEIAMAPACPAVRLRPAPRARLGQPRWSVARAVLPVLGAHAPGRCYWQRAHREPQTQLRVGGDLQRVRYRLAPARQRAAWLRQGGGWGAGCTERTHQSSCNHNGGSFSDAV